MRKKIDLEEVERRIFEKHGDYVIILEYLGGTQSRGKFVCKNGHVWNAVVNSVLRGCGCSICAKKARLTIEEVSKFISECGCILLSTEYKNLREKLIVEFECGHMGEINFKNFRMGHRCVICKGNRISKSRMIPKENVIAHIEKGGYKFIDFIGEYNGIKDSLVKFSCNYGHINERHVYVIWNKLTCVECTRKEMRERFSRNNGNNWQGGTTTLYSHLGKQIREWKIESMKSSGYRCVITGDRFENIHHLYSKNLIMEECSEISGLNLRQKVSDYNEEELNLFVSVYVNLHKKYPGVCLREDVHKLFHEIYGAGNNTPKQFEEFKQKIALGEILIPI